jgi:hypothetical protein
MNDDQGLGATSGSRYDDGAGGGAAGAIGAQSTRLI